MSAEFDRYVDPRITPLDEQRDVLLCGGDRVAKFARLVHRTAVRRQYDVARPDACLRRGTAHALDDQSVLDVAGAAFRWRQRTDPQAEADRLAKLVPNELKMTLDKALEIVSNDREMIRKRKNGSG